jgi:hypothetical protein
MVTLCSYIHLLRESESPGVLGILLTLFPAITNYIFGIYEMESCFNMLCLTLYPRFCNLAQL